MEDQKPPSRAAAAYKRLRAKYFFVGLCTFIGTSVALHLLVGYDADWGITNLVLSMEASVAVSMFMMISDRQEETQRKQAEYMLHLLEAQHALIESAVSNRAKAQS